MGHLRCERVVCAGVDERVVDLLDQSEPQLPRVETWNDPACTRCQEVIQLDAEKLEYLQAYAESCWRTRAQAAE